MTADVSAQEAPGFLAQLFKRPAVFAGTLMLAVILLAAVLAPWITPHAPGQIAVSSRLSPPGSVWWLGSDEFGRDVFTRTIFAGRISLVVGAGVVLLSGVLGIILGLLAGFFRRLDPLVSRVVDAMMAFPDILLAIALIAALGSSTPTVIIALGIVYAPRMARIVRASTLVIRELPYVEAARALGVPTWRIMTRHILRNLVSPILVQSTFVFAYAILAEAGLSFLGLGVSPEIPTWGTMIAAGKNYVGLAPWMTIAPGAAIVLSALSLQMIGDGVRDVLDPRLRREV